MGAMDLLIEAQTLFVTDADMGTSELISYTHKSGLVIPELRCFVGDTEFHKRDKDDATKNQTSFSSLVLSEDPTNQDTITYDGKIYKVRSWEKSMDLFIIHTDNNKRKSTSSRNFK